MDARYMYLDHAATTPVDPEVVAAMLPYFGERFGNPSSIYRLGRLSLEAVDTARSSVAEVLNCSPREIVFTGGGSESDNLAIKGAAMALRERGKGQHIITSAIEHHAVLHACEYLETQGFEVTVLPVNADGLIDLDAFEQALRSDTVLATIMYANNEIGVVQPIAEIGALCRERGVVLHTDAVQAGGALPLDVKRLNVDLLTLTAHKFYGPKGSGALYVRQGTPLTPQINGGGQERRRRAGTENVPGIVGFAHALRLAEERRAADVEHCLHLRERLINGVLETLPQTALNGHRERRLPNNANLAFEGVEGESLLLLLDQQGVYASAGSACTAGSLEASHVLKALGISDDRALGSIRFTVGRSTTEADIDHLLSLLPPMVERLRSRNS